MATVSDASCLSNRYSMLGLDSYSSYLKSINTTNEIVLAVIDSGCADVDVLNERMIQGYDFVDDDNDAFEDISSESHGTFIASIIVDITDGLPIKIMPIRILENKDVSVENLVKGIEYAVDNGADIINISIGGVLSDCSEIDSAIAYADENDVTVVVSAGNTKKEITDFCPSHNESCITVSAVNYNKKFINRFSNYGDAVDCCAFGESIEGYNARGEKATLNGTSFSAAIISAGCAMMRLHHPEYTAEQTQDKLKSICIDLGDEGKDKYYGFGIPDFNMMIPVSAGIKNYTESLKVGYNSTIILRAENDIPFDSRITWFVNGQYYSDGETFTMKEISEDYEIYFTISDSNGYVIKSETEKITVKKSFFNILIAFFELIFNKLPCYVDNVKQ